MLTTKSNSYTFQKSGIWYFSRRIPTDLRRHYRTGRIANLICTAILFLLGLTVLAQANSVADAQRLLNQLGYNAGRVDGLFGGKTKYALEEFYLLKGDAFDGKLSTNEIMDLSLAAEIIMPGCSVHGSPTLIKKNVFSEVLFNKIENSMQNSKYFPKHQDTRYGPFLHWIYEDTHNYVRSHKPVNLKPKQAEKLNLLLNKLCFVQKTKTGQRAYFLAATDFLDSIESLGDFINEGHALLWPDFPYIDTGNKVIPAPNLEGLEFYKKYASTSGVIIVGGKTISDKAMLAARKMLKYQLSERPDLHPIIRLNKMRVSLFRNSTCELPEFQTYCEEGGFAMSETDATMPVNARWLCYPGNKNIGGNPLYHEMAHSLQHIIFESMNDLKFYELLPDLIDQAYKRKIVPEDFPAGEVWAVAVEGYMMDGGKAYKSSYSSRNLIKREHPKMYDLIVKYFPKSPTDYCQF